MPTVGLFSQQYWNGNRHTNQVIVPLGASMGGYPLWQSSVSVSVLGPPLDLLKVFWGRLRWSWRALRLLWRVPASDRDWLAGWLERLPVYSREERYVYDHMAAIMASHTWPDARVAVQTTATTAGFNEPKFWKSISTKVQTDPGHAAQLFRHLHACQQVKALDPTVSSHDMNLAVEAAYHAFTQIPKKTI